MPEGRPASGFCEFWRCDEPAKWTLVCGPSKDDCIDSCDKHIVDVIDDTISSVRLYRIG